MIYREAVAEGRRLVRRSNEDGWRLIDLTGEVLATGKAKREWARDLGVNEASVRRWAKIVERWPAAQSRTRPTYGDAYSWALEGGVSAEADGASQRRMERDAINRVQKMEPERRAEVGRQLLGDERVMEAALGQIDEQERKATAHHPRPTTPRHPEAQPEGGIIGTKASQLAWMALDKAIARAQGELRAAVRAYDEGNFKLTPEAVEYLDERVDEVVKDAEMVRAALHNRVDDAELQAFLGGGK